MKTDEITIPEFMHNMLNSIKLINDKLSDINNRLSRLELHSVNDQDQPDSSQSTKNKYIKECIEYMDWDKIHNVMEYLNWTWCIQNDNNTEYICTVPSVEQLKKEAESLLRRCYDELEKSNESDWRISTGGLNVHVWQDYTCKISFELDCADAREWQ